VVVEEEEEGVVRLSKCARTCTPEAADHGRPSSASIDQSCLEPLFAS